MGPLVGLVTSFGLTALLAQIGCDQGKMKEPRLYERWGGKPTTQLLRHRDSTIDENTKGRYYSKLAKLIPGIEMPREERKQQTQPRPTPFMHPVFAICSKRRVIRSDSICFSRRTSVMGFAETWGGMKLTGMSLSLCGLVASVIPIAMNWPDGISAAAIIAAGLNALLLALGCSS
jgi:hypothetical protein